MLSRNRKPVIQWNMTPDLPPLARFLAGDPLPDWASGSHQSRADTPPVAPSFAACLDRAVRADLYAHASGREPLRWRLRDRVRLAGWLERNGYRTAEIMASGFPLEELPDRVQGLERFVVKPTDAHSSLGVMALVREGGDFSYVCVETGARHDIADLLDLLAQPMQAFSFPDRWQIEELLLPPGGAPGALGDFKFYAFHGQAPLVLQAAGRGEHRRYRWFDQDWTPVRTGKYEDSLDDGLALPGDPDALMEVASRLSAALPVPFCRVDLYETSSGVAVGELTPEPGEYHVFDAPIDLYLGACFEQVAARLSYPSRDGIRL